MARISREVSTAGVTFWPRHRSAQWEKKVTNFDEFELPELSDSDDDDLSDAATFLKKMKSVTGDMKGKGEREGEG